MTKIDLSGVPGKLNSISHNRAMGQSMATKALAVAHQYVPMKTGDLRGTGKATPFKVTWGPLPYARKVFYGRGLHFVTPGTMAHWDEGIKRHIAQIASAGKAALR